MTLGFFTIGLPSASSSIGLPSASSFGSSPFAKESCAAGSSHASSSEPPGAITSVICKLFFKIDGVERERHRETERARVGQRAAVAVVAAAAVGEDLGLRGAIRE